MWSALGKYKSIVVSIALFLLLDASVLILNFYISFKIADDAVGVNLAGRQRMLSQRTVKSLYEIEAHGSNPERLQSATQELQLAHTLFDQTLKSFDEGGEAKGADGATVTLKRVTSENGRAAIDEAKTLWQPYSEAIVGLLQASDESSRRKYLDEATGYATQLNLTLLKLMNNLTVDLENVATNQAKVLRLVQTAGISLAIINFLIILVHFIGELRSNDRKLEAARQETTEILNTVNEGLFLLDKEQNLGSQHSEVLSDMFGGKQVTNISFTELISDLVKPKDLETAQRFIAVLFRPDVKSNLIRDLNPLNQVELNIPDQNGGYITRYMSFEFSRVYSGDTFENVLVTVSDITLSVQLAAELAQAKEKSEQQMEVLTSLLHTEPNMLKRFIQSAFDTFGRVNELLKVQTKNESAMRRKLDSIFVEVHNFKGDASALELDNFADLAHTFEDEIDKIKQQQKLSGNDFLTLTVHLESLFRYTESVQEIAEKLASFSVMTSDPKGAQVEQNNQWDHLYKLCDNVASRCGKQADLLLTGFRETLLDEATRTFVNDVTIQFVRNAIVHSIEEPTQRKEQNKSVSGRIDARLLHLPNGDLELSVRDDGMGIQYKKIREKALQSGRWDAATVKAWDNRKLLSLIFESGFSTAEQATEDAGRGVGMDVIRTRVNDLNGKLKVASRSGVDCQFTIILPASSEAKVTIAA